VENLCVYDAFTVPNSIMGINRPVNLVKGIIDRLDIEWSGISRRLSANEPVNSMRGNFVENNRATIAVTATTPKTAVTSLSNGHGFRFVSDPASTSVSHFAEIGEEWTEFSSERRTAPVIFRLPDRRSPWVMSFES
jgi:hypothetical protein